MEARVGIEPTIEDLQSSALPLGDRALKRYAKEEAGWLQDQVNFTLSQFFKTEAARNL